MAAWLSCDGKTGDGMCGLAGDALSVGSTSGPLCLDSKQRQICLACFLLVITLMKPIH